VKIAYIFQPGRLQRFDDALVGNAATEFFYGALELRARGHDVSCYELGNLAVKSTFNHLFLELVYRAGASQSFSASLPADNEPCSDSSSF
jgi:hypothetical protein